MDLGEGAEVAETLPFDGLAAEVLRSAADAARAEARASAETAGERLGLHDGHPVGSIGADRLWSFGVAGDTEPAPETPADLVVGDDPPRPARVLAVGDGSIVIGVREELGLAVGRATLSLKAGFILERLADRLDALASGGTQDGELLDALLHPDPGGPEGPIPFLDEDEDEDEVDEQARAAAAAIEPGARFTWGPPGTGKTGVLADAVHLAVERGQRVLVVAHANAAVDVAAARIAAAMEGHPALTGGRVLRLGTPHMPVALDRHDILPDRVVADREPGLADRRDALLAERRALSDASRRADGSAERAEVAARLREVRTELAEVDEALGTATRALVDDAQVLATTISKAVVDDQVWRWPADVLVVDEASMAPYPALLGLVARGGETASFVGDFRQLPPIAISQDPQVQHWFARDVFAHAEVVSTHEAGHPDDRVAVLRTQHRMGEQICGTISAFAYDGMLVTDTRARDRAIRLAERWPEPGTEVVVVDTSSLGAACGRPCDPVDRSRFGAVSAAVTLSLAETVIDLGGSVGLISPYRAQVGLLRAALRSHPGATAATIHRFQGSEQDSVVVDLVDAPGVAGPSRLTGTDADLSRRLLNVAASRSRGKLLLVVHLGFVEAEHPVGSRTRALLRCAADVGAEVVDARQLLEDRPPLRTDRPVVRWHADVVAATASGLTDPADDVVVSVPDRDHERRWLGPLRDGRPLERIELHGPTALAPAEEATLAAHRLTPFGPAPVALVGDGTLLVGGTDAEGPIAEIRSAALVAAYRRLVLDP